MVEVGDKGRLQQVQTKCRLCGKPLIPQDKPGKGRPRIFCCVECRQMAYHLDKLAPLVERLGQRGVEVEAGREIRSRLWSFANSLNQAGRP